MNKEKAIIELLNKRIFDDTAPPPPEQVVFRIDFNTIGSLGDYGLLTGKPKNGKTKYLAGCLAAIASRKEVFGMQWRLPPHKNRILHIDSEQGKLSHYKLLALVKQLMDIPQTQKLPFHSLHCRQDSGAQMIAMIEQYLKMYPETGAIFADGLIDFVESINDEKHAKSLVNWLKRITEANDLFIFGVLHRSVSADKSIGHLGSTADRAAQSVLVVEKDKTTGQFVLRPEYLRDAAGFDPIAINYNKQTHTWERVDYIEPEGDNWQGKQQKGAHLLKRKPSEYDISELTAMSYEIFKSGEVQTYDFLRQDIKERYNVGRDMAGEFIKIMLRKGIIFRLPDNRYTNISQAKLYVEK